MLGIRPVRALRRRILLVAVPALSLTASAAGLGRHEPPIPAASTSSHLQILIGDLPRAPLQTVDALTIAYYGSRTYHPAWLERDASEHASLLLERITLAEQDGLCVDVRQIERLLTALGQASSLDDTAAAELDVSITRAIVSYLVEVALGHQATAERASSRRTIDLLSMLDAFRAGLTVRELLSTVAPRHAEYHRLRGALAFYRAISDAGGWPRMEHTLLRPGDEAPADVIGALLTRLSATGDVQGHTVVATRDDGFLVYDDLLVEAVRRFQLRHGLLVDGIVGPGTIRALNVPAAARAQQIALNMDRWRRLPDSLGERHVRVNVPAFRLRMIDSGTEVLAMRVIVGTPSTRTPVFSDRIRYVQFRPYWNVPDSIARGELLPKATSNQDYLRARGYEVLDGWSEDASIVDPGGIDWQADRFAYRLRQRPGPQNALGLVKFMFPNRYSVYLHDTPAGHLFERRTRALSHGCVRVENPVVWRRSFLRRRTGLRTRYAQRCIRALGAPCDWPGRYRFTSST